jgi:hypothetical protein
MEPVYGIHLGLVVSDGADPEGRNRIQVWIPHLSNTLYKSINSKLSDTKFNGGKDLVIKSPSDLNAIDPNIVKTLRTTLPWAEYGAPLFGGSSGNYNNATGITSTTNTNPFPNNSYIAPVSISAGGPDLNHDAKKDINDNSLSYAASTVGNLASQSIGTPYHMGISSQCANWVNNILSQAGVQGSGSDWAADFQNMGTRITDINQVQPGDVVITRSSQSNSGYHAGLATLDPNNGSLVFASKHGANRPIEADPFNGSYVQSKFAYAIRLDGSPSSNSQASNTESSGPRGVTILNRSGAYAKEDNIGTAGSAVGTFTTPNAGSKVWVFFMGGDVQRPVYFAQAINKGDVTAVTG